ncbi:MAG: DUF3667 domain-containing protein [Bacteroidota bacterium]
MTKQTKNVFKYCRNCFYPLARKANYCPHCGQKYTLGKLTVRELLDEFFEAILNVDSKIFQSVITLFKPGRLTKAYFDGQHKRYVHPLRIFLVTAILFFAVLGYVFYDEMHDSLQQTTQEYRERGYSSQIMDRLQSARGGIEIQFGSSRIVSSAIDSLLQEMPYIGEDTMGLNYMVLQDNYTLDVKNVQFARKDVAVRDREALLDDYGVEGFWARMQIRQLLKIDEEGGNFAQFILGKLIWMVLLMMPMLALILKLLYWRRDRYFVEHLVFSFHYHAFAFVVASIVFLSFGYMRNLDMDTEWIPIVVGSLWVIIYQYKAMRYVYQQGRIKTFIKYNLLNIFYPFIFAAFLVITVIISGLLF